ncbi:glucosamine-6-phosphate deaminase [Aquimarina sediminis]|uniref:glucosamine-6-phosphate deaminase n=1 Tax=Aquimarina sediminis TaxID=2070536 RepID=UPI000C9FFD10|nr:glucosamine-6-phosphate deaminase [Aquimarina sediminis]
MVTKIQLNDSEDISYKEAGIYENTKFEKIHNVIFKNSDYASVIIAREIATLIREKQAKDQNCVLGLATGSSPIKVYAELVRLHKEENLSFANVVVFNLDEYYPMDKTNVQSYHYFMHEHLLDHVDILPENIHIPDGTISSEELYQYFIDYELKINAAGGLDFQLLGIGRTGHIGFNEPGSHPNSGTRIITLNYLTRSDAAQAFFGIANVPKRAITMGVGTIKKARRIVIMALGHKKAEIVKKTIEGNITSDIPASYLQEHKNTTFVLDQEAAGELTRIKTPWLVESCIWSEKTKSKSIAWLSQKLQKPILKLTDKDYNDNGMSGLLAEKGSAYDLNISMFNKLQSTITGWPGGKPNADDANRPERNTPHKKRVLILSPHPDDDVISMGGTFLRLIEQGHEVHVAYQTSGNIAVSDAEAIKYAEVVKNMMLRNAGCIDIDKIISDLKKKKENTAIDSIDVRALKGLIRRVESLGATRSLGLPDTNVNFLDLPFYETGTAKKKPYGKQDVAILTKLIREIKPHQIYAAGDLADPHGTHKVCLDILFHVIEDIMKEEFMIDCWVWLYRGAWHEWDIHDIEMAVPLSPDEVEKKRKAIFFHQSQKDNVMFQGDDAREFWVRAEERNKDTAIKYHQLGLTDYAGIEAFKRYYF